MMTGRKRRRFLQISIIIVLGVFLLSTGLLSFMYIGTVVAPSSPEEAEGMAGMTGSDRVVLTGTDTLTGEVLGTGFIGTGKEATGTIQN